MPTLRRYVNDPGYYVVTTIKGCPVTFQLTKAGEEHLTRVLKLADRSRFEIEELLSLIKRRWAYTNRSGPGEALPPEEEEMQAGAADPRSHAVERECAARLERHLVLRFEATDQGKLESSIGRMVRLFLENGTTVFGPLPLPTRVECYKVLTGSGAREYRVHTHKRLVTLIDPQSVVLQQQDLFDVPPGVDVKIRERTLAIPIEKSEQDRT
jgi:small subunit ribosomal protein S10